MVIFVKKISAEKIEKMPIFAIFGLFHDSSKIPHFSYFSTFLSFPLIFRIYFFIISPHMFPRFILSLFLPKKIKNGAEEEMLHPLPLRQANYSYFTIYPSWVYVSALSATPISTNSNFLVFVLYLYSLTIISSS